MAKEIVLKAYTQVWEHYKQYKDSDRYGLDLRFNNPALANSWEAVASQCPVGRKIIRALGLKDGPVEVVLRRPQKKRRGK